MHIVPSRENQRGFSLIELAVVLLILSVLLYMGLGALSTTYTTRQYQTTDSRIVTIRSALVNYLRTRNHLPCPDTDFATPDGTGEDNRATANDESTACAARFGLVPYKDLGIDREVAMDGWNNFFSYKVSNVNPAAVPSTNRNWTMYSTTAANEFFVGNDGGLSDSATVAALGSGITNAAVIIISHGPNGYGAYTEKGTRITLPTTADATLVDEQVNTTNGTNFVDRPATDVPPAGGGTFDDVVSFMQPKDLLDPLIQDGAVKSAEATLQEQFADEKSKIIGQILSLISYGTGPCSTTLPSTCPPERNENTYNLPASGALITRDPWGTQLRYIRAIPTPIASNTASGNAFTIRSYGPTRADDVGAGDDIDLTVTIDEVKGLLAKTGF
ncbi:MAG: prepilin-type N-terminal cleavage/methylation domain-containing protein [Gammaproteobacteria bacterium]